MMETIADDLFLVVTELELAPFACLCVFARNRFSGRIQFLAKAQNEN